jgi:hypothetical protein
MRNSGRVLTRSTFGAQFGQSPQHRIRQHS